MNFKTRDWLLLAVLSLASCRGWVLEDRVPCPRLMYFDIVNAGSFQPGTPVSVYAFSSPSGELVQEGATSLKEIRDRSYRLEVRNTPYVEGYGLIGGECLKEDSEGWRLPPGTDYAQLFRFSFRTEVPEESCVVPVELVKEYVGVRLQFVGESSFDIRVRAATSGISPGTGTPLSGDFECVPEEAYDGVFTFNLPRLCDASLSLDLYGREGVLPMETLDLYRILLEDGGLTWKERNLPDVALLIDYLQRTIEVEVTPWGERELLFEY